MLIAAIWTLVFKAIWVIFDNASAIFALMISRTFHALFLHISSVTKVIKVISFKTLNGFAVRFMHLNFNNFEQVI